MAIVAQSRFNGGISESKKEGVRGSYQFGVGINIHDEPSEFTSLPEAVKVSGTAVTGLVKWIVSGAPYTTSNYAIDENGVIYQGTSGETWTSIRTVSNCKGQGLAVYSDYLYYTQNSQIGRYGPLSGSPTFTDNWQTGLNDTSSYGFAPILTFKEGFAVGHGNNLSWWDGSVWTLARLTFPPGLYTRSLSRNLEFLMIGTHLGTSVTGSEQSYVFAWDGIAQVINYFNTIEEGANNALLNRKNNILSINGTSGGIYLGYDPFVKLHQLPKLPITSNAEVWPGAVTNWKGGSYIGFAAVSTDTNFLRGAYRWGAKTNKYPDGLSLDFVPSTGNTGDTVSIGALFGKGDSLYMSWKDGSDYGIDKVSLTNSPFSGAYMDSLMFDDGGKTNQEKSADAIKVIHSALASGEAITISYSINRGSLVEGTVHSYSADDAKPTETIFNIPASGPGRFRELYYRVTITASDTTAPTVYWHGMQYDDLREEMAI